MTAISPPVPGQVHKRRILGQLAMDSQYVLLGFPLALISFTVLITGFLLGLGLAITLVGLPVLAGTLVLARWLAQAERARIQSVLGRPPVRVRYQRAPAEAGSIRRLLFPLTEAQAWLDLGYGIIRLPVSVVTFSVALTWWAGAVGGLTYPLYQWALPATTERPPLPMDLGAGSTTLIAAYLVLGAFLAGTLPFVVRACAWLEARLAWAMLNSLPGLRAEMAGLVTEAETATRRTAAAVSAEAVALRKLERDIHDGPQQRLVRLAVDLGRVQRQLESDPSSARATVDEALEQAKETLDELRTLSRGIAPPVLTDRGLAAAVATLAARATVPVQVDVADFGRLDALAEQTAYFTVAEALTNMAKHSGAGSGVVRIRRAGDLLTVTVTDDGHGGAQLAKGHGLAGLADRLRSAGGKLTVTSPDGGPTMITAELPCQTVH